MWERGTSTLVLLCIPLIQEHVAGNSTERDYLVEPLGGLLAMQRSRGSDAQVVSEDVKDKVRDVQHLATHSSMRPKVPPDLPTVGSFISPSLVCSSLPGCSPRSKTF
jgi:hypothetical protein